MSDEIIIPKADVVITEVLEKLYELRPNAFRHCNYRTGVYWHPIQGYRAQVAKMLQRLADLAGARRLKTSTGTDLLEYVASEFGALPATNPTFAEGTVTLGRTDLTKPLLGGVYPKGTKVTREQYTDLGVTFPATEYETLTDAHLEFGSEVTVTVPIRASRTGPDANAPILIGSDPSSHLQVPNIIEGAGVVAYEAGGGADKPEDPFVRIFAQIFAAGQFGPTSAASKYGALNAAGVRDFLVYDHVSTGTQTILVADGNWGSSARWAGLVQKSIYDNDLVGFGCKVGVFKLRNRVITVDATVALRDGTFLAETTDIDQAIQAAVRSYFDDRQDWNIWNELSLRGTISKAHSKVYSCPSVTVKDSATGSALSEIITPDYTAEQVHFLLASNAMRITYVGPSP